MLNEHEHELAKVGVDVATVTQFEADCFEEDQYYVGVPGACQALADRRQELDRLLVGRGSSLASLDGPRLEAALVALNESGADAAVTAAGV